MIEIRGNDGNSIYLAEDAIEAVFPRERGGCEIWTRSGRTILSVVDAEVIGGALDTIKKVASGQSLREEQKPAWAPILGGDEYDEGDGQE